MNKQALKAYGSLAAMLALATGPAMAEDVQLLPEKSEMVSSAKVVQQAPPPSTTTPPPFPDPQPYPIPSETQRPDERLNAFDRNDDGCTTNQEVTESLNEIDAAMFGPSADHTAGNGAAAAGAAWADWILGTCRD